MLTKLTNICQLLYGFFQLNYTQTSLANLLHTNLKPFFWISKTIANISTKKSSQSTDFVGPTKSPPTTSQPHTCLGISVSSGCDNELPHLGTASFLAPKNLGRNPKKERLLVFQPPGMFRGYALNFRGVYDLTTRNSLGKRCLIIR